MAAPISASPASPPITPPAMAPALFCPELVLLAGASGLVGGVGLSLGNIVTVTGPLVDRDTPDVD